MRPRLYAAAFVAALAIAWVLAPTANAFLPPYCTDGCAYWRPCDKLCRQPDETIITCGEFGICENLEPSPPPCAPALPHIHWQTRDGFPAVPGSIIDFTSAVDGGQVYDGSWNWDLGDATHVQGVPSLAHVYTDWRTYRVDLYVNETHCYTNVSTSVDVQMGGGASSGGEVLNPN